ncbi:MAG: hypothetical protein ACXV97_04040 [Chthoniobacterales bacterium]
MKHRTCIVVTTINKGDVLDGYCRQIEAEGMRDRVRIIVIPDRKTPNELYSLCGGLSASGFDVRCPTIDEQENYLKKLPKLAPLIPYDSENRRNVGYLMALESGYEVLLSIDDDNYCLGETFATCGLVCSDKLTLQAAHSDNGWINFCDMLELQPSYQVFPRGYPYARRTENPAITYSSETGRVRMNVGLWLAEPDLDAITWLAAPVRARKFKGESCLLGQNTWSPINTQNTALHRNLIVSYYCVRMGYPLGGMPIDRFGDIFSGYLSQACIRHLGDRIRVGTPIADHKRNSHNYLRDLASEFGGIQVLEPFVEWLHDAKLEGSTYPETYLALADAIDAEVSHFTGSIWNDATRGFFHQMTHCMRQWVAACNSIA